MYPPTYPITRLFGHDPAGRAGSGKTCNLERLVEHSGCYSGKINVADLGSVGEPVDDLWASIVRSYVIALVKVELMCCGSTKCLSMPPDLLRYWQNNHAQSEYGALAWQLYMPNRETSTTNSTADRRITHWRSTAYYSQEVGAWAREHCVATFKQ